LGRQSKHTKTHIYVQNLSFNNAVYERVCKDIVEQDRPQTTIWRMHIACWIPKGTNTKSEYVVLIVFYCNNGCTNASQCYVILTLILLTWRKWWTPNNASKWQMGFNSAFKGL